MNQSTSNSLMPVVFVGHGNPMNAITRNPYAEGWYTTGASMPKPRAILCVSAHWYIRGVKVTAMNKPRTIHDFGGFPQELYDVQYPAPGSPELAAQVAEMLQPLNIELDQTWGLDHGTWAVLVHMFPQADIPVVQLSIDRTQPASFHYDLGQRLAPLRNENVLILTSGNLVHNLHSYAWGGKPGMAYDWAVEFEALARGLIEKHDHQSLIAYDSLGRTAMLSIPTPDHYLPFLYAISLCQGDEPLSYPVQGFDGGSVSMLSVRIG